MAMGHHKRGNYDPSIIEVKAKFEFEFRRFSMNRTEPPQFDDFYSLLRELYHLPPDMPFTISYIDPRNKDLLPLTNNHNLLHALGTALPLLKILVFRKQDDMLSEIRVRERKLKKAPQRPKIEISSPLNDLHKTCAVIDVDLLPDTVRRVKLLKRDSDEPLSFFIKSGTSTRVTPSGSEDIPGIFISRLVPGGGAERCGLLAVNDEILEVNGIEVAGKTLDQVIDIISANEQNLIITVKPEEKPVEKPVEKSSSDSQNTASSRVKAVAESQGTPSSRRMKATSDHQGTPKTKRTRSKNGSG